MLLRLACPYHYSPDELLRGQDHAVVKNGGQAVVLSKLFSKGTKQCCRKCTFSYGGTIYDDRVQEPPGRPFSAHPTCWILEGSDWRNLALPPADQDLGGVHRTPAEWCWHWAAALPAACMCRLVPCEAAVVRVLLLLHMYSPFVWRNSAPLHCTGIKEDGLRAKVAQLASTRKCSDAHAVDRSVSWRLISLSRPQT